MERKVIESFHYAADGKNARRMKVGRVYDFTPEDAARFETEGYLEIPSADAAAKPKRKRSTK